MEQPALFAEIEVKKHVRKATGPHQEAVDGWTNLWRETRGIHWVWTPKELKYVKEGVKLAGSVSSWLERARALLTNPPRPFYWQAASPSLLYSHWMPLAPKATPAERPKYSIPSTKCKRCGRPAGYCTAQRCA